jgi:hypothetical protein
MNCWPEDMLRLLVWLSGAPSKQLQSSSTKRLECRNHSKPQRSRFGCARAAASLVVGSDSAEHIRALVTQERPSPVAGMCALRSDPVKGENGLASKNGEPLMKQEDLYAPYTLYERVSGQGCAARPDQRPQPTRDRRRPWDWLVDPASLA